MCSVNRSESIGHKNIRKGCKFLCKLRIILLFFFTEAKVFKQENFALAELLSLCFRILAH